MSTPVTYRDLLIDRYRTLHDWVPPGTPRLLDLGCGNGIFSEWLARRARFVCCADHNAENLPSPTAVRAVPAAVDATRLPFDDATFDVVMMSDILEHVDDDAAAAREALRVLRPGGRLIISLPNRGPFDVLDGDNLVNGFVAALGRLGIPKPGGGRFFAGIEYRRHRHYSETQIRRLLAGRGKIVKTYYGGTTIWPLAYLVEKVAEVFLKKPIITTDWRWLRRLRGLDFKISMGIFSYNLLALVRKGRED